MYKLYSLAIVVSKYILRLLGGVVIGGPEEDVGGAGGGGNAALNPVYDAISAFGPPLLGILSAVTVIYTIVVSVQYAKADTSDDREKAKKRLVYGLVGFGVIIILVSILYWLRAPLTGYIDESIDDIKAEE